MTILHTDDTELEGFRIQATRKGRKDSVKVRGILGDMEEIS